MGRKFHIATMGCQMNEYDSDHVRKILINSGFSEINDPEDADLILVNTCSVRAKAEQKAYSSLGRMSKIKKCKPDSILGVMGCIAQQEGNRLLKRFPELDFVVGTREIDNITNILEKIDSHGERLTAVEIDLIPQYPILYHENNKHRVKDYISIMMGCDNFCSYCIVPYVRGKEVSRSPKEIINEAEHLVSEGIREITFLGQNVNSYRWQESEYADFPQLLKKLSRIDDLVRMRFTTSHPKDLSLDLMKCFDTVHNLCPHIHLPFQAGSNRILNLMNRKYTREHYIELIDTLREIRPDMCITSDVMVGFPSENNEDFKMTLDLIQKIEFDNLYSFKYSDRKGTLAAKMEEKIDEKIKSERLEILQNIQKKITLKKNIKLMQKKVEVLVDGVSKKGNQFSGRTESNLIVNFNSNINLLGSLVKVFITNATAHSLYGKIDV